MAVSLERIEEGFAALLHGGVNPPKVHLEPGGMQVAVKVYQRALQDMDDEAFELAIFGYLRKASSFWPTPGQLLAIITAARENSEVSADEAWGRALMLASGRGRNDPPGREGGWQLSEDRELRRAMAAGISACGGWVNLCNSSERDAVANRAAFRRAYEAKKEWYTEAREELAISSAVGERLQIADIGKGR